MAETSTNRCFDLLKVRATQVQMAKKKRQITMVKPAHWPMTSESQAKYHDPNPGNTVLPLG